MNRIAPGTRVGDRYLVLEEIGGGGVGVVFRARDESEDRDVALKVLRELPRDGGRRLRREAAATSGLDSRRVAKVYEVGETPEGELYLVMEYIAGKTARQKLREGRVQRAEALRIIREVAKTLGQAHRQGLVHRDVKPDNVMLADDGRVVLLDFGLVKTVDMPAADLHEVSTHLTGQGTVLGTPAYLAPEQAMGRPVGPAADQFGLAVTAFELLTGQLPWSAKDMTRMLGQVIGETPRSARGIEWGLAPAFDEVLGKGLAKKDGERFKNVEEFAEALGRAERGERPRRSSGQVFGGVIVVGLLLALGAIGVAYRLRSQAPTKSTADSIHVAATLLSGPEGLLACPILPVEGADDAAAWFGAAVATLACDHARWYLGGDDARVLVPAALLSLPTHPTHGFGDPYAVVGVREATFERARARAAAYLDGVVVLERNRSSVSLIVKAPDGREIAAAARSSEGRGIVSLSRALDDALAQLWSSAPLVPRSVDSDIQRWTDIGDVDTGILWSDLRLWGGSVPRGCAALRESGRRLGKYAMSILWDACARHGATGPSPEAPAVDESSPSALVLTIGASLSNIRELPSTEEMRRWAEKSEALRETELTRTGRGYLALRASTLRTYLNEPDRADADAQLALAESSASYDAWRATCEAERRVSDGNDCATVAAAWVPYYTNFLGYQRSGSLDVLVTRARTEALMDPSLDDLLLFGRLLAHAGRAAEARAVAADAAEGDTTVWVTGAQVEATILSEVDAHEARVAQALKRLDTAGPPGMSRLLLLASVLRDSDIVADRWANAFMAAPHDAIVNITQGYGAAPIALCMLSRRAVPCLDRIDLLGHEDTSYWVAGTEAFLAGAKRYAKRDMRGAVAAWRPIIVGAHPDVVVGLPTEVLERFGESDLAARLDDVKMGRWQTLVAGVSEAAPRVAKRAFAAGDLPRARELAQQVITAWEVADVPIPAVPEMRALLKKIDQAQAQAH